MPRTLSMVLMLVLALALPLVAVAADMQIEPGKWEFETVSKSSMGPGATHKNVECIADGNIDPRDFEQDMGGQCALGDVETTQRSMKWTLTCKMEQGTMKGDASYTTTGKTVSGRMDMVMEAMGMKMTNETRTEGRYLGPCD